jgi:hypothetical protein
VLSIGERITFSRLDVERGFCGVDRVFEGRLGLARQRRRFVSGAGDEARFGLDPDGGLRAVQGGGKAVLGVNGGLADLRRLVGDEARCGRCDGRQVGHAMLPVQRFPFQGPSACYG